MDGMDPTEDKQMWSKQMKCSAGVGDTSRTMPNTPMVVVVEAELRPTADVAEAGWWEARVCCE
jgi:hypothetical protein